MPTSASADELCQMIDGKLTKAGREVLISAQPTSLEDKDGKFLTVPAAEPEVDDHTPSEPKEGDGDSVDEGLKEELEALKGENQVLHDQVSLLEQAQGEDAFS